MSSTPSQAGLLSLILSNTGYLVVSLTGGRREQVHALVAEAFIGPRPIGFYVDHIDGCKTNAAADNLEYVRPGENARRAYALGLKRRIQRFGTDNNATKLSAWQVREIKHRTPYRGMIAELARQFNVSTTAIGYVRNGRNHANG